MNVQFDAKTESVIEKVRKLLALADNNDNEHQAEAAADKARELLEAYNLDMAVINRKTNTFAPRSEQKTSGGLYTWQRTLWNDVASLNFCKYWYIRGHRSGGKYEHQLLGSRPNVIGATIMAQYLQATIERLARDWVNTHRPGKSIFIKEAIAFREGVASRLSHRLWTLRQQRLKEEEAKVKAEREANAARGVFTENAMVLADVISNEEDLNNDHLYGWPAGTSAQRRRDNELRRQAAEKDIEEALRKQEEWDAANPEAALKRKAAEQKKNEEWWAKHQKKTARPRRMTAEEERRQLGSYRSGYAKGDEISLDKQVDEKAQKRIA